MNRLEFQRWLDQFPEDTTVEVLMQEVSRGYESYGECFPTTFTANEDQFTYTDLTGNQFVKADDPSYNKRFLLLGEAN